MRRNSSDDSSSTSGSGEAMWIMRMIRRSGLLFSDSCAIFSAISMNAPFGSMVHSACRASRCESFMGSSDWVGSGWSACRCKASLTRGLLRFLGKVRRLNRVLVIISSPWAQLASPIREHCVRVILPGSRLERRGRWARSLCVSCTVGVMANWCGWCPGPTGRPRRGLLD